MPNEVVSNVYANFGLFGLVAIGFFVLVIWTVRCCEKREEKLYKIIDTLSLELPEIRKTLDKIKHKIFDEG